MRTDAGDVKVASGRKPRLRAADGIPGVRGVARLGEAFAVIPLVKRGLPEARLPFQDPSVLAVAAGASLGGTLLRRAPQRHRRGGRRGPDLASRPRCSPCAAASSPPTTASSTRRSAPTRPTTHDAADATKEHERCGSHLVAPMLASNLAGTLLLRRAVEKPGPLAGGAVALASTAAAVEVFAWCERNAETRAAQAAPAARVRDPAPDRHARAGRAPARGRPRARSTEILRVESRGPAPPEDPDGITACGRLQV